MLLNIYLNIRLVICLVTSPRVKELESYRKKYGIKGMFPCLEPYLPEVQYICPALPAIGFPFIMPKNVTTAGQISFPAKPVSETDPELASWLQRKPTIFVNLSTQARLPIEHLREIANGLEMMLDRNPGFQVLWKLESKFPLDAQIATTLRPYLDSDEVRITPWLTTDPSALLQTGTIICSVHHGGGNSFYEATGTRILQVVLPLWYDTYDFAARVEHLGIGIRGNKRSAPSVDGEEIGAALSTIIDDTAEKKTVNK